MELTIAGHKQTRDLEIFVRIEDKYLLPKKYLGDLLRLLDTHLQPVHPRINSKFVEVESLYFDSPTLKIYRDHFRTGADRFKLRLRTYKNNAASGDVFLELKRKSDGISRKVRFQVDERNASRLKSGKNLLSESANSAYINSLFEDYLLKPQARLLYLRQAYESPVLRVTLDQNLSFEILNSVDRIVVREVSRGDQFEKAIKMVSQYLPQDFIIVEVKHLGLIPSWLTNFFFSINLKQTKFSKYCFAVTNEIMNSQKMRR